MTARALIVVAIACAAIGCRDRPAQPAGDPAITHAVPLFPKADARTDPLDPSNLFLATATESSARVQHAFPHGVATEHVRAQLGTVAPPPRDDELERDSAFVAEIMLPLPISAGHARAVLPEPKQAPLDHWVRGRIAGSERWMFIADGDPAVRVDRIAVILDLVTAGKPITAADLDRESARARGASQQLGAPAPQYSMTPAQAIAKSTAAIALHDRIGHDPAGDNDIGVSIVAPNGHRFAAPLVWDVAYSAGFVWGDGDYFQWVPSPDTDIGSGIEMGSTTAPGYFLPEDVAATDGSADVDGLEMSFSVARTWQPTQMCDAMIAAATYMARRLGGTLANADGSPFDAAALRRRTAAREHLMVEGGVVPGSTLAQQLF